jgi:hypothetical protein
MARPEATRGGGGAVVVGLRAHARVRGVFASGGSGGGVGRRVGGGWTVAWEGRSRCR